MNDDYLWDRSGDADPDIAELEELLSGLSFDRNPTSCPAPVTNRLRRPAFRFPGAIAAAAALIALSGALLLFARHRADVGLTISPLSSTEVAAAPPKIAVSEPAPATPSTNTGVPPFGPPRHAMAGVARGTVGSKSTLLARNPAPSPTNRAEGERAKDELLLAMRIASAKLNMAQRIISVNKTKGRSS
jgi:hypothetical protein